MRQLIIVVAHHIVLIIVANVDVIMPRVGMLLNLQGAQSVLRDAKADIIPIRGMRCLKSEVTHNFNDLTMTVWTL